MIQQHKLADIEGRGSVPLAPDFYPFVYPLQLLQPFTAFFKKWL